MSITREVSLSTTNKHGFTNTDDGKLEVNLQIEVSDSIDEAVEFYGSEEKLLDAIQADQQQRRCNAARPVLRDAETELDWQAVAQRVADDYAPGRKGGFGSVEVSSDAIDSAESMEDVKAILAAAGVKLS